ncbi:MAG TPA: 3-phosphoserine/phosphohydroxythreonine transaminase [Gammaproteobacteria bacterium]|nr:3-phosphoserine/phosphohydroxythreonine transaminase [Gammaproteobacteria bacterium]
MSRVFNFSPGPAALPEPVLEQAQRDLLDWQECGMSVMEMSHRSSEYLAIAEQAEADLRELLAIPDNYSVLFLQGGATHQFSCIPLNFTEANDPVDYFNTGIWSKKAIKEAQRFVNVNIAAASENEKFTTIPDAKEWRLDANARYCHYTHNETIGGLEFNAIPEVGEVPLVSDMSSTILSRPLDVSKFGMIYAGAQKNIGPAGLTVVIVREDLLGRAREQTPSLMNYQIHSEAGSMSNTPPTFAWYLAGLVFAWLKEQGGLTAMAETNRQKSSLLYGFIDGSDFYHNPIAKEYRSWMNVPFTLADEKLDGAFLSEAKAAGLYNLKGHRSVGGMRASIYNAVPLEAVEALVAFMKDFEQRV